MSEFDKREVREGNREIVALLKSDLYLRVPGGGSESTYGQVECLSDSVLPGDHGYRWRHTYIPQNGRAGKAIEFDAGASALWASPLGWRVLLGHPDYEAGSASGITVQIIDPMGEVVANEGPLSGTDARRLVEARLP